MPLEVGVESLRKYQSDLLLLSNRRENLVKAEMLFMLPIPSYPELVALEKELRSLKVVYDVYVEYSQSITEWSNISWSKIDIQQLLKGVTDFDKKVRKMSKDLGDFPVGVLKLWVSLDFPSNG